MAKKKAAAPETSGQPLRLEYVDPNTLDENPNNWRTHPAEQTKALGAVMDKVGWAGALLYNARTCRLVDGHARRKLAIANGVDSVPVLVGDWSEEEEKLILATLDPIAAMAEANAQQLDSIMRDLTPFGDSEAISALITSLAEEAGLIPFDESEAREPKGQREGDGSEDGEDGENGGGGEAGGGGGKKGKPGPETYRDMQSIVEYRIVFDDEEQQDLWFSFLKHLKTKYPNADTIGNRLSLYLNEVGVIPEFDEFDDDEDDDEDRPPTDFSFGKDDDDDEDEDEEDEDE